MAIKFFKGWKIGNDTYKVQDERADNLGTASTKNSTSVVTSSSDLVESGAVKDIVGWGNKNYFTAEGITTAYYLNQNGTTTSSTNWRITDYIDISDLSNIELKGIGANGNTPSLCFYDSNKDYISGIQYRNRTDIITVKPSNAVYSRVSVFVDDMETIILTHASVDETKCDNSVIGTVEDGATASQAYAVGEHMIRGGKFCTVINPVTTSSTWTLGSNYVEGDVASGLSYEQYTVNNCTFYRYGKICFFDSTSLTSITAEDGKTLCTVKEAFRPNTAVRMVSKIFNGSEYVDAQFVIESTGEVRLLTLSGRAIENAKPNYFLGRPCYIAKL